MKGFSLKTIKSKLILILIALMLVCALCFAFTVKDRAVLVEAETVTIISDSFKDEYNLNAEVEFPSEVQVTYEGQPVTAKDGLIFEPDGEVSYVGAVKLEKLGEYKIRYFFDDANGNKCVAEKKFRVSNMLYGVSTSNGSVTAVTAAEQASDYFDGNAKDVMLSKTDGLIVRLSEGDTFNLTTSIDLANVGEDGLCNLITLDYKLTDFVKNPAFGVDTKDYWKEFIPQTKIARYCIVRLSDSYDLGNYIELYFRYDGPTNAVADINTATSPSNYYGAFSACAVGQVRTALTSALPEGTTYATYYNINLDGETLGLYKNNEKGGRGFSGRPLTGSNHTPYTWKYDYLTNKIYIEQSGQTEIVSALSSSEIYGTDTFEGFSSSKVQLSVYMSEYLTGDQARIDINSIGEYSGAELVENYGKLGFFDTVATPVIDLGFENTDERGIYVPFGADYTLPIANAFSNEQIVSSKVFVYTNYGTPNQIDIPVSQGKIKIDKDARYTVKYEVINAAGCIGEKTLIINPVKNVKSITLNTSYDNLTQVDAGSTVVLPEYTLSTINRVDKLSVKIKAVHEKETINVNAETRTFIPSYKGEYKIIYECADNVSNVTYEYSINCVASQNVSFIGEFTLPRYFIKNTNYSLDVIPAYSFENGEPTPKDVSAFISFDGGENYQPISNPKKVKIIGSDTNDTAIIKYTCGNVSVVSEPVKIIDVGYGDKIRQRDYFVHDNFNAKSYEETGKTNIQYDSLLTSGNNKLEFVNALDMSSLSFSFKIPVNLSNYEKVNVILTDYYDTSVSFVVSFINRNGNCYISVNGETAVISDYKFADNNATKKLVYNSLTSIMTINGVNFNSIVLSEIFNSSLCYLDVELVNINGNASIIVDNLNYQTFSNSRYDDKVNPLISFKDFSGEYELGTTIDISVPCVTDVLSTVIYENISLFVEKDGEILYSVDGVKLDSTCDPLRGYKLKLDSFGQYSITFTAKDSAGRSAQALCYVSVVDTIPPELSVEDDSISLKVGSTLDVKYSVTDDITPAEDIVVTLFMMDVKTNAFYTFNEFKISFTYAGEFDVYLYAKDAAGNVTYNVIRVIVG